MSLLKLFVIADLLCKVKLSIPHYILSQLANVCDVSEGAQGETLQNSSFLCWDYFWTDTKRHKCKYGYPHDSKHHLLEYAALTSQSVLKVRQRIVGPLLLISKVAIHSTKISANVGQLQIIIWSTKGPHKTEEALVQTLCQDVQTKIRWPTIDRVGLGSLVERESVFYKSNIYFQWIIPQIGPNYWKLSRIWLHLEPHI